jgi:hypothetical protein
MHHTTEVLWHGLRIHAIVHRLLVLRLPSAFLLRFFLEKRPYADATGLGPKVTSQGVRTRKSSSTAPVVIVLEDATTHKFLFSGMQTLMPLPIVLASECLSAHVADERTFIGMGA